MNVQQLLESSNQYKVVSDDAKKLSSKWTKSGLLEGIKNENDRTIMSTLLENQAKQLVSEANITGTQAGGAGAYSGESWNGVALPLVRRVFGEIAAKEFVSVQPMNLPSGLVFYLDFKYGSTKAPFTAGDSMYSADPTTNVTDITKGLYEAGRFSYSVNTTSSVVTFTTSSVAFADVNYDSNYTTASLTKITVAKAQLSTISGSFDTNAIRSFIINSGSAVTAAGVLQQFTTFTPGGDFVFIYNGVNNGISGSSVNATFSYSQATTATSRGDFEDGAGTASNTNPIVIPSVDVQLKSEPIVAKTRKLKAQWTPEFAQDLNAYHSVDAEAELTGILSQYISMEIDLEILDMLIQNAFTVDYWSAVNNQQWNGSSFTQQSATTGGFYNTQGGWFQTIGTKLQKASNKIHQLTLRGGANFLVCSPTVATVLESIPGFAADGDGEKMEFNFGIQKIGSLNSRYKVYKNPYMTENVILLGYKGAQFLECGAVFAPYVPLIMTPLLYDPSTFTPRKGLMTRYAKKMIRPDYYGKIYVSGLETV